MRASGIILAGGASRRMGVDKATLTLNGETLLARAVRLMSEVTAEVLVVGRAEQETMAGVRYVPDDIENAGPLGGILSGLRRSTCQYAAVAACDMPFLRVEVIRLLLRRADGYDAAVPRVAGRAHPTLAVYSREITGEIEDRLARGERALNSLLEGLRVRWVDESEIRGVDPDERAFRNINTPRDWAWVQQEAIEPRTG